MSEDFVSRNEFNNLKQEVQEIKIEMNEKKDILQAISRKCDVITERLENTTKISDLQNENIETRITSKIEPIKKDIATNKSVEQIRATTTDKIAINHKGYAQYFNFFILFLFFSFLELFPKNTINIKQKNSS